MRIVEPYAKMVSTYPDGRAIITQIATAARTSHKSESSGYEADLELVRKLIGWGHLSCLEHAVLSADIRTDRGVTHELVRHRLASYVQESTRYVDYADGIEIVLPHEMEALSRAYQQCLLVCKEAELAYIRLRKTGTKPEIARAILPTCLKADIFMTANLREWRTIFALRCDKAAHPDIRWICCQLLEQFREYVPVVFDDLETEEADVATVRHGRWVLRPGTVSRYECSCCHCDGAAYFKFFSYCPDCGARMDEKEESV